MQNANTMLYSGNKQQLCCSWLTGIPQDKSSAADMYEKAALLGERGAEEDAKRLRKEIQERGWCIVREFGQERYVRVEKVSMLFEEVMCFESS